MKKNLTKNIVEDDENLLSILFIEVNECQEDISTRIANAMEVRGDNHKHIYEDIYKQMTSLSDHQKNLNNAMQENNEKKEKGWDERFVALSKKIEAKRCRGFASKDPRPKFGAIQYFNDDRTTPYTMKDVPGIMGKQLEGDQRLWVAKKNQELKKGKSPTNSDGNNVTEAYHYYIIGQVYDEYFVDEYLEDFRKLREHINEMLEKRSMENSRTWLFGNV
nr:hypothetical protein Iba_chr11bCG11830 [Ipomoea batatas]